MVGYVSSAPSPGYTPFLKVPPVSPGLPSLPLPHGSKPGSAQLRPGTRFCSSHLPLDPVPVARGCPSVARQVSRRVWILLPPVHGRSQPPMQGTGWVSPEPLPDTDLELGNNLEVLAQGPRTRVEETAVCIWIQDPLPSLLSSLPPHPNLHLSHSFFLKTPLMRYD